MSLTTTVLSLAYDELGDGPPVLLIHGFPLSRRMWAPQLTALADAGYRAIAPDLPGFGESVTMPGPVSMDDYADAMVGLLDRLGIAQAAICGMSMGGYVLLSLLDRHPTRCTAAVLSVTRAGGDDAAGRQKRTEMAQLARTHGVAPVADVFAGLVFAPATERERPELVAQVREWMLGASPAGVALALEAMRDRTDYGPELGRFTRPALVIGADQDRAIPLAQQQLLAQGLPAAELAVIHGAGHMANLEQTAAFNAALTGFLKKVWG